MSTAKTKTANASTDTGALPDPELCRRIYEGMVLMRATEDRLVTLYRQGELPGSVYTGHGHEGIAVGTAILPSLSRQIRLGHLPDAVATQNRGIELALLLTLPAAVALGVLATPILAVLFDERSSLGLVRLRVRKAGEELGRIFEAVNRKQASRQAPSIFSEITDDDIDKLFGE